MPSWSRYFVFFSVTHLACLICTRVVNYEADYSYLASEAEISVVEIILGVLWAILSCRLRFLDKKDNTKITDDCRDSWSRRLHNRRVLLLPFYGSVFMEAREDLHRIAVGNVQHWQTLCSNYRRATLASLQSQILAHGLNHETDALHAHIDQVRL